MPRREEYYVLGHMLDMVDTVSHHINRMGHTVLVQLVLKYATTNQCQKNLTLQFLIQAESISQTDQCTWWLPVILRMPRPASAFLIIVQFGGPVHLKPSSMGGINGHLYLQPVEPDNCKPPLYTSFEGFLRVNNATIRIPVSLL